MTSRRELPPPDKWSTVYILLNSERLNSFKQGQKEAKDVHSDHFYCLFYWKFNQCKGQKIEIQGIGIKERGKTAFI